MDPKASTLLGGSWVVITGVISRVTILTSHIRELITPLITTHEPPSKPSTLSYRSPGGKQGIGVRMLDESLGVFGLRTVQQFSRDLNTSYYRISIVSITLQPNESHARPQD